MRGFVAFENLALHAGDNEFTRRREHGVIQRLWGDLRDLAHNRTMLERTLLGIAKNHAVIGDAYLIAIAHPAGTADGYAIDHDAVTTAQVIQPPVVMVLHQQRMAA